MFKPKFNDKKFKTNVRLCINRLKLVEKKKTEMALKARKEIADYIKIGKADRARIRVEHIIREDYLVEGLEITEMFLDLILARVGLINLSNEIDPGMKESISSVIWVQPRIVTECPELKIVCDEFTKKYGKEYMQQCRSGIPPAGDEVSKKLMKKLSPHAPPKSLIENYLVEIAKNYNVPFEPDRDALLADEIPAEVREADLIAFNQPNTGLDRWDDKKNQGGGGGGFGAPPMEVYNPNMVQNMPAPMQPSQPPAHVQQQPTAPFQYPSIQPTASMRKASDSLPSTPGGPLPSYNSATVGAFPMRGKDSGSPGTPGVPEPSPGYDSAVNQPQDKGDEPIYELADEPIYDDVSVDLGLPEIPNDSDDQSGGGSGGGGAAEPDDDFDDLQARFNALKKK